MKKNELIRVRITDINNLGCGVGHLETEGEDSGLTVFVRGGVTGDELLVKVIKVTKHFLVGKTEQILSASPHRTQQEFCSAAMSCGGCAYRQITYAHELELKHGYVVNAFRKAGLPDVEVETVRTAGVPEGYRNKAQYPVQNGKDGKIVAGFYANASHRIVETDSCLLQPKIFTDIVRFLCDYADRHHIRAYSEEDGQGLLRHFYLRIGAGTGEVMVCLVLTKDSLPNESELIASITKAFPEITSLFVNINPKNTNVVLGETYRLLCGNPYIEDILCGLRFRISPKAFYQVNRSACELLYVIAKEKAGLSGTELLLDLYCGIGSIGLSMADRADRVVGMEIVDSAVKCANENAERNGIRNASFYCGDAGDPEGVLSKAREAVGDLSGAVAVIDPPRKGTTEALIRGICGSGIEKVVYVSCNPDTLARDCVVFRQLGYEIGTVTPVDLFPRTGHVENVVLLTKSRTEPTGGVGV